MRGCDYLIVDEEEHESLWMKPCGEPVVRDGKCEKHKVERRKTSLSNCRRKPGSSDSPVPCGNSACHWEHGEVRHHLMCPDRGPGWA